MHDRELIHQTLERLGERGIDITPRVYERFFAACPEARPLFSSTAAAGTYGRMLFELFQIVADQLEDTPCLPTLMETTVNDHRNWGATAAMYPLFLEAFTASLCEALGDDWDADTAAAWQRQVDRLLATVKNHFHPA